MDPAQVCEKPLVTSLLYHNFASGHSNIGPVAAGSAGPIPLPLTVDVASDEVHVTPWWYEGQHCIAQVTTAVDSQPLFVFAVLPCVVPSLPVSWPLSPPLPSALAHRPPPSSSEARPHCAAVVSAAVSVALLAVWLVAPVCVCVRVCVCVCVCVCVHV